MLNASFTGTNGKVTQVHTSGTRTLVCRNSTVYTAASSFASPLQKTPTVISMTMT